MVMVPPDAPIHSWSADGRNETKTRRVNQDIEQYGAGEKQNDFSRDGRANGGNCPRELLLHLYGITQHAHFIPIVGVGKRGEY